VKASPFSVSSFGANDPRFEKAHTLRAHEAIAAGRNMPLCRMYVFDQNCAAAA
jgi:hypothetical protein